MIRGGDRGVLALGPQLSHEDRDKVLFRADPEFGAGRRPRTGTRGGMFYRCITSANQGFSSY